MRQWERTYKVSSLRYIVAGLLVISIASLLIDFRWNDNALIFVLPFLSIFMMMRKLPSALTKPQLVKVVTIWFLLFVTHLIILAPAAIAPFLIDLFYPQIFDANRLSIPLEFVTKTALLRLAIFSGIMMWFLYIGYRHLYPQVKNIGKLLYVDTVELAFPNRDLKTILKDMLTALKIHVKRNKSLYIQLTIVITIMIVSRTLLLPYIAELEGYDPVLWQGGSVLR